MRIVLFTNDNVSLELVGDKDNVNFRMICPGYRAVTFSTKADDLVHQINLVTDGGAVDNR